MARLLPIVTLVIGIAIGAAGVLQYQNYEADRKDKAEQEATKSEDARLDAEELAKHEQYERERRAFLETCMGEVIAEYDATNERVKELCAAGDRSEFDCLGSMRLVTDEHVKECNRRFRAESTHEKLRQRYATQD